MALVLAELERAGTPHVVFNQRHFAAASLTFEVAAGRVGGRLRLNGDGYDLADFSAVFPRLMDDRFLPELEGEPVGSAKRVACRALHDGLMRWAEIAPARVVNRAAPMSSNFSKPYQAQLIRRHGFEVPA